MYYRQQPPQTSFFPFPSPGGQFPGYPSGDIDRRLDRIERQLERHTTRLNRLNQRLRRVERQLGYGGYGVEDNF